LAQKWRCFMATEFTNTEKLLLRAFGAYVQKIFNRDDAKPGTSLVELVTMQGMEDVESASLLGDNEFGHELAAGLCRRAVYLRKLAQELTQFLEVSSPAQLEDLKIVQSLNYEEQLWERHPELFRNSGKQAAPQKECRENDIPPTEPEQSAIRINLTNVASEPADNSKRDPWVILSDLQSLLADTQHHCSGIYANGHDAAGDDGYDGETVRKLMADEYRDFSTDLYAVRLHVDELYQWLRDNGIQSAATLRAREAIARGREIRAVQS